MCIEELGGIVILQDPVGTHPHQADIDCLNRHGNVHDGYMANNPSSVNIMMKVLKLSLASGNNARISSFLQTNVSPSVIEYKIKQRAVVDKVMSNEVPNDNLNESGHFRMVNNASNGPLHFRRKGQSILRENVSEKKEKRSSLRIIRSQEEKLKRIKSAGRIFSARSLDSDSEE